jgi:hypothetical protein
MVIYATEFILWCGVFVCGGHFNLMPWIRQKISTRRRKREEELSQYMSEEGEEGGETGGSNDVELRRIPSSTSVFRTPSSVVSDGISMRSRTVD